MNIKINEEKLMERERIIFLLSNELCSTAWAAQHLSLSLRQTQRLIKSYRENNNNPLLLLGKPKKAWNKKKSEARKVVLDLKKQN